MVEDYVLIIALTCIWKLHKEQINLREIINTWESDDNILKYIMNLSQYLEYDKSLIQTDGQSIFSFTRLQNDE